MTTLPTDARRLAYIESLLNQEIKAPSHHPQTVEAWEIEWARIDREYEGIEWTAWVKAWSLESLYFYSRFVLSTRDWPDPEGRGLLFAHPWFLARCVEFQYDSDGVLTVLPRYHGKSTMLTFCWILWRLITNPSATIGVFSITLPIAIKFTGLLKLEMESNKLLNAVFPEVFWGKDPRKAGASKWTEEKMVTRRPLVFKDPSIQAYGLLDSSFTGARITDAVYDDIVNEKCVTNPDMVEKVLAKWRLSLNIAFPGITRRYCGTWYATGDPYHEMLRSGLRLRMRSCFEIDYRKSVFDIDTGIPKMIVVDRDKPPVLWSKEHLEKEERMMGPVTFAMQMLCNPAAYELVDFKREWVKYYRVPPKEAASHMNTILLVDPANEKKASSNSRTAMWVVGLGPDKNAYLLDGVLDRLNLVERTEVLFELYDKWKPYEVRYEKYGMQSDIEHIKDVMERRKFHFRIVEVAGRVKKEDRIRRLVPFFQEGRMFFPTTMVRFCRGENEMRDLVDYLVNWELAGFPNVVHVDGLDALARLLEPDMILKWPKEKKDKPLDAWREAMRKPSKKTTGVSWMAQ